MAHAEEQKKINAGGQGVHYAEGIRWDESTREWIEVPMPNKYICVLAQGAFETPSSILNRYVWDTQSRSWLCDESDVHFPLFRRTGTNFPLNCWEHRLDDESCHCEGIDDIRNQFKGFDILVNKFCFDFYSEEACPTCPTLFIDGDSFDGDSNDCYSYDGDSDDSSGDCPDKDFCHTQICQFRRLGVCTHGCNKR